MSLQTPDRTRMLIALRMGRRLGESDDKQARKRAKELLHKVYEVGPAWSVNESVVFLLSDHSVQEVGSPLSTYHDAQDLVLVMALPVVGETFSEGLLLDPDGFAAMSFNG